MEEKSSIRPVPLTFIKALLKVLHNGLKQYQANGKYASFVVQESIA